MAEHRITPGELGVMVDALVQALTALNEFDKRLAFVNLAMGQYEGWNAENVETASALSRLIYGAILVELEDILGAVEDPTA